MTPRRRRPEAASAIFAEAAAVYRAMRDDFELVREAAYVAAETACNGNMLNTAGKAAGVSPYGLWIGPWTRAELYASRELLDWWEAHGRPSLTEYERQWLDAHKGGGMLDYP